MSDFSLGPGGEFPISHLQGEGDPVLTWFPFFFSSVLGLELRALTLIHSASPFCDGIFKIGSRELFAQSGFELGPS
jgi:hypothetical protein